MALGGWGHPGEGGGTQGLSRFSAQGFGVARVIFKTWACPRPESQQQTRGVTVRAGVCGGGHTRAQRPPRSHPKQGWG